MSTAATGGFAVLAAIALQLWLLYDSPEPPRLDKKFNDIYDYIVVGAGSAGCVVASRLSEDKNVTVLLLEAGDFDDHLPQIIVPRLSDLNYLTQVDWGYVTEPQNGVMTGVVGGRSYWPRGRVLGGTSSLNGMMYVRASRHDYDRWARYTKDERWSYKYVLPYFKKSEDIRIPELQMSEYHGHGGNFTISRLITESLTKKIIEAGQAAGYPYNEDYNGKTMEGIAYVQMNILNGERMNTARVFIHPVLGRCNLHVAPRTHVTKIIIKNKRAVGVEVIRDSRRYIINARREIILSAGSIGSPQILMLSGVGHRNHLESLKIPVVADLPVGQNLQDHLSFDMTGRIREALTTPSSAVISRFTKLQYAMSRSGPLSTSGSEVVAFKSFTNKTREMDWPDIQIIFALSIAPAPNMDSSKCSQQDELADRDRDDYRFSCIPFVLRPESRGNITLLSADPFDHPIIHANYLDKQEDADVLIQGIHECQSIVGAKPLQDIGAELTENGTDPACKQHQYMSHEYYDCLVKRTPRIGCHPVGTCKMGPKGDLTAVVDSELKVQGISGLRVADASIMPWLVSGNTNGPAIMIGERAADLIKGDQLPPYAV